jgi:hypothetical protein
MKRFKINGESDPHDGEALYWSDEDGWVDFDSATIYNESHLPMHMPNGNDTLKLAWLDDDGKMNSLQTYDAYAKKRFANKFKIRQYDIGADKYLFWNGGMRRWKNDPHMASTYDSIEAALYEAPANADTIMEVDYNHKVLNEFNIHDFKHEEEKPTNTKVFVIKRKVTMDVKVPYTQVFLGLTEKSAKAQAAEVMADWWVQQCEEEGKDPDKASAEEVYKAYVNFWSTEESWTIEEREVI